MVYVMVDYLQSVDRDPTVHGASKESKHRHD